MPCGSAFRHSSGAAWFRSRPFRSNRHIWLADPRTVPSPRGHPPPPPKRAGRGTAPVLTLRSRVTRASSSPGAGDAPERRRERRTARRRSRTGSRAVRAPNRPPPPLSPSVPAEGDRRHRDHPAAATPRATSNGQRRRRGTGRPRTPAGAAPPRAAGRAPNARGRRAAQGLTGGPGHEVVRRAESEDGLRGSAGSRFRGLVELVHRRPAVGAPVEVVSYLRHHLVGSLGGRGRR